MSTVTHPRLPPRRGSPAGTWWSKAVLRAVEEAAFSEGDLKAGRMLARAGAVGGIGVSAGSAVAAVAEGHDVFTVEVSVPVFDETAGATFVEVVGAQAGRIASILGGQLPHQLVEAMEEAGVELIPYGGEFGATCTCETWLDPCRHALAVLTQLAWLIQRDPFVLTHLRGMPRDRVLRDLHQLTAPKDTHTDIPDDFAVAQDAAERALRAVDLLQQGRWPEDI